MARTQYVSMVSFALLLLLSWSQFSIFADAHGFMLFPNQRGALSPHALFSINDVEGAEKSAVDWKMHFPSGDKSPVPGSARRYQIKQAGVEGWAPYNPFDPNFKFRAGLCGDTVDGTDHRMGGTFYDNGRISAEFMQGSVIDVTVGVVAHHNGFMELYLCDVGKCGGDISHKCFLDGHCIQLQRARFDECENGQSTKCGPSDPNFPGRWYLPCASNGTPSRAGRHNYLTYGPGFMKYQLPRHVTCHHCVLQWYWVSADICNPPGLEEYFEGEYGPKNWGACPGNADALGGYARNKETCDGSQVPEEYYQCSDIRIQASLSSVPHVKQNPGQLVPPTKTTTTYVTDEEDIPLNRGKGAVRDAILIKYGKRVQSISKTAFAKYEVNSEYTVEAFTTACTEMVNFVVFDHREDRYVANETQSRSRGSGDRFYLFGKDDGNGYPKGWRGLKVGNMYSVMISAADNMGIDIDRVYLQFT